MPLPDAAPAAAHKRHKKPQNAFTIKKIYTIMKQQ